MLKPIGNDLQYLLMTFFPQRFLNNELLPFQQFAIAKSMSCCGFISSERALIHHYHCTKKIDPPPHVANYARCYTQKVKRSTLRPIRALF